MIVGIKYIEKIILIAILMATITAIAVEFLVMFQAQEVTLADLLLLFIYIEVVQMVREYWTLDRIRISIPLFIAITALARFIILQGKAGDPSYLLFEAGAILLIAVSVLVLRMRKLKIFEDSELD